MRTFQSTPPRGKRPPVPPASMDAPRGFQSTPPRGKRLGRRAATCGRCCFNPRPRAGSDLPVASRGRHTPTGFNPRPRAGSDPSAAAVRVDLLVSIHAPAREATPANPADACPVRCFNPRPRAGSDAADDCRIRLDATVSIHAPAREATSHNDCWTWQASKTLFQSTPPRGKRPVGSGVPAITKAFQSTPPRGKRHLPSATVSDSNLFQSTPPRGKRHCRPAARRHHHRVFNPRPRAGSDICRAQR